jgi:hypothetical protein
MTHGQVAPNPAALVESIRALGYTLETAVADLLDNSISAGATKIQMWFDWNNGEPFGQILDDGRGMTTAELVEAMRLGGQGPHTVRRADDLGRFGLGLKTGSFSQCSRLTVTTRRDKQLSCARWDLDLICNSDTGWTLLSEPAKGSEQRLNAIKSTASSGTLVLWELLRTGAEDSQARFLESLERLEHHLSMIFHRFLDGDMRRVRIELNGRAIAAWDPFITWHAATSPRPIARIRDPSGDVSVRGHVLPHRDRFKNDAEFDAAGGPEGWVAQQGFYLYRAGRLIISGGWMGLGGSREWLRDQASQLARIRIDILNTTDAAWRIDVRKATAKPPGSIRDGLVRIAADIRRAAREVLSHRGQGSATPQTQTPGRLWSATSSKRYPYSIKRAHPAVQAVFDMSSDPNLVEAMLVAIERAMPAGYPATQSNIATAEVDELVLAARTLVRNLIALGVNRSAAVQQVATTEPFDQIGELASLLQSDN